MSESTVAGGGVDPWPQKEKAAAWIRSGGTNPWPFSLGIEGANKQLSEGLLGMKLRVFTPENPFGTADYLPDRVNITVDADHRITSVTFG